MCFEPTTQNINIESVQHFEARTNIEIAEWKYVKQLRNIFLCQLSSLVLIVLPKDFISESMLKICKHFKQFMLHYAMAVAMKLNCLYLHLQPWEGWGIKRIISELTADLIILCKAGRKWTTFTFCCDNTECFKDVNVNLVS